MKRVHVWFLALAALAASSFVACATLSQVKDKAEAQALDCGKQTIQDAMPNLLPDVNQILIDTNRTESAKEIALDQLTRSGAELLGCAVRKAYEDLSSLFVAGSSNPDVVPAKSVAAHYMAARFKYADGFAPSGAGGAGGADAGR